MNGVVWKESKEFDDKIYKLIQKSHISTKINEVGTRKAVQSVDEKNGLNGPVNLMEVDINELIKYSAPQKDTNPIVKIAIENIVAPLIEYELKRHR